MILGITKLQALAMTAVFSSVSVFAQAPPVTPPQTPYGLSIDLQNAKKAAAASIAEAHKNGWNMAIAVVDTGGNLVYFEKLDNTQIGSVEVAIDKARTAALFRRPSKVFQDAVAAGGEGLRMLRLRDATPIDGGFPIIIDGKIVGAIGASGGAGDQDGRTAKAGSEAFK